MDKPSNSNVFKVTLDLVFEDEMSCVDARTYLEEYLEDFGPYLLENHTMQCVLLVDEVVPGKIDACGE